MATSQILCNHSQIFWKWKETQEYNQVNLMELKIPGELYNADN